MRRSRFAACSLLLASSVGACTPIWIEADEPKVCASQEVDVPGTPLSAALSPTTLTLSEAVAVSQLPDLSTLGAELYLDSVKIEVAQGVPDLGFVSALSLTLDGGQPPCAELPLSSYRKPAGTDPAQIEMVGPPNNLMGCLGADGLALTMTLSVSGQLPVESSTLVMNACFSGKARLGR